MDGTFYLGSRIIEGSLEFIRRLKETGQSFLFYTNNSSETSEFYREKLLRMGCKMERNQIMTSGDVTVDYLQRTHPGKTVYVLGTDSLRESFRKSGIRLNETCPDIVVAGFDKTLIYDDLRKACGFLRKGALFLATNPDFNCPTEDGFIPDCGSLCALLTASTGKRPEYLGKPQAPTLSAILNTTGYRKDEIAFVGDRLYTDIAIGANSGATSILVLSGETSMEDVKKSPVRPDFIFPSLRELAGAL